MDIRELLKEKIVICDGAMGTMIQKKGLEPGAVPELLNFTKPDAIEEIHSQYFAAGSDFVVTNTFGANRYKTQGCGHTVDEIIAQAVKVARTAADKAQALSAGASPKFVALDVAPIGRLMEPYGDMTFQEAYDMFREQIAAGCDAGVDLIVFETFTDLYEMKIAVLAAKENCDLPVFCTVTFQEDGRMLMGADPATVVSTLQDMGIDAIGLNCSLGPKQILPMAEEFLRCSKIPVMVQPNAGLPAVVDGETVFDVTVEEYVQIMAEMVEKGVGVVGGCCGTSPEYIRSLAAAVNGKKPAERKVLPVGSACSATNTVFLDDQVHIIGERINPTGKKKLKEALRSGDFCYIEDEAMRQVECGAHILDVNVGLPELDEAAVMCEAVKRISGVVSVPLQIDSADPEVIERAVRVYNGKPLINSVNGKEEVMEAVFPIVKKYGTCVIALTLDEKGLPENTAQRLEIAERIIKRAAEYGITPERILVDCLTLTVSAQPMAGLDTLEAIRQVKARYGVKTTLGASNVSFGLPERKLLNRTFLAMALEAGLDAPITDPTVADYAETIQAYEVLSGKDTECRGYIGAFAGNPAKSVVAAVQRPENTAAGRDGQTGSESPGSRAAVDLEEADALLREIIINGYEGRAAEAAAELLKTRKPLEIVEEIIIPSLGTVGSQYESGEKFLPQLMKSADTVTAAFRVLKEVMERSGESICYGKVLLATVQGDIHDIGKNIVKVILQNYGYEVIDLGKDVPIETVVSRAREEGARLVGLSALMTTTVANMEKTIAALKAAGLDCKTAVGGAVLTGDYAAKIGADFYCRDALDTVKAADQIFK